MKRAKKPDPSDIREGTPHEEYVHADRAFCRVCGPIEGDTPDPVYHADHYASD